MAKRKTLTERLYSQLIIDPVTGCLNWQGRTSKGYGQIGAGGKMLRVHRVMYEMFAWPIPAGLQLDHLCRNRACANVAHLEPVTNRVNVLRGNTIVAACAAKTHCPAGHPYDEANTMLTTQGWRRCRECHREQCHRAYHARSP